MALIQRASSCRGLGRRVGHYRPCLGFRYNARIHERLQIRRQRLGGEGVWGKGGVIAMPVSAG